MFSFGTPSSAPATTGLSAGFNFGGNKPATPNFGLNTSQPAAGGLFGSPATSEAPAFGATSAAPAFGAAATPAFGAAATPAFGAAATPGFGATATPGFGATAAPAFGTSTPAFGATSAAPAFGTATPALGTAAPAFGAAAATPAFGTSSAAPAFGTTTTPAFGASAAPTFGTTTTPAFGASAAPTFGANTSAFGTTAGGLNFGAGSNAAPATGLSFGAPTATTASTGLGGLGGNFGFGTPATQNTGFGAFGSTSTATTTNSLFGGKLGIASVTGSQPSTSVTTSFGLGGVAGTSSGIGAPNATADAKNEPPKQNKLPNEISTSIDAFKEFVKKQKSLSSEVMRVSIKPLHKVSREAEARLREVTALSGDVSLCRAHSRRLRAAAAAALAAAEAANRDHTQPGSELEGTAPPSYVKDLISELEQQLITFRRQMDVADKQMQSSPKLLTEQELTLGIRRMHESLVALAGRLQAVHAQVEAQKEQYLNLRKYILKDPTDVFDVPHPTTALDQILREAESNRKKMKSGTLTDINQTSAVLTDPRAVLGNLQHLAGPTPFTYVGSNLTAFPTTDISGTWQSQPQPSTNTSLSTSLCVAPTDSSSFQLQKPPGKRGKQ